MSYDTSPSDEGRRKMGGGMLFLMFAWLAAAGFFLPFALVSGAGILAADPAGSAQGGADAGGLGSALMDVVGVALLGSALAYGAYRYHTRDRRKDVATEAATAALYDTAGKPAEPMRSQSPNARPRAERDGLRPPNYG